MHYLGESILGSFKKEREVKEDRERVIRFMRGV